MFISIYLNHASLTKLLKVNFEIIGKIKFCDKLE